MPGPGQYDVKTELKHSISGTSAFASKVIRASTAQAGEIRMNNNSRASKKVGHGFLRNAGRPGSTSDLMGKRSVPSMQ